MNIDCFTFAILAKTENTGILSKILSFFVSIITFPVEVVKTLISNDNWKAYGKGIANTLAITLIALVLGLIIGIVIAIIKYTYNSTGKLKLANRIATIYTTVIRGTPVMVQLLIITFYILKGVAVPLRFLVAGLAFGINSGAYMSEIIRSGIESVDKGQTETGRSLGLNSSQTMKLIVLPQAVKNILPTLFNEAIALLKETSISSVVAVIDISSASDNIRATNFSFTPLLISAMIYLVFVMILTKIQRYVERRLSQSDKG